jgi:hypothetical protein
MGFEDGAKRLDPRSVVGIDPEVLRAERRSRGRTQVLIGGAILAVGVVITAVTYGSVSQSGGSYVIAYGPIIFGFIRIIRGLSTMYS